MTDDKKPQEKVPGAKVIAKRRVHDGYYKVDECDIEMDKHDGGKQTITRNIINAVQAVGILGYDPVRDEVVLINELRTGPLLKGDDGFGEGLPAGGIDKGEDALQAAEREFLEETGSVLKDAFIIHAGAYMSAGSSSETMALVCGIVDTSTAGGVHGKTEEKEDIKTVVVSSDEFIRRAENGMLREMKSLTCAFWLAQNRDRLRKKYAPEAVKKDQVPKI